MPQTSSLRLNLAQNSPGFELESLEDSPPIFKYKLFEKTLNSIKDNPENPANYRTITIKCLYPGCK
jgi:hypothetical protein